MLALHLTPVVLAALLLAAHFFRADMTLGVVAALALVAVTFVRRPWAARLAQAGLVVGGIEWLRTMATFAAARISLGQPYLRMVVILATVTLVTALAALLFERRAMRRHYGIEDDSVTNPSPPSSQVRAQRPPARTNVLT